MDLLELPHRAHGRLEYFLQKDNYYLRTVLSIIANYIVRLFSKSKIHDHGCAFKIVKKNTIDDLTNWGDFHRLLAARLANSGFKVNEIEVKHNNRKFTESIRGADPGSPKNPNIGKKFSYKTLLSLGNCC